MPSRKPTVLPTQGPTAFATPAPSSQPTVSTPAPSTKPFTYEFCDDDDAEGYWTVERGTVYYGQTYDGVGCLAEIDSDKKSTWVYLDEEPDLTDVQIEVNFAEEDLVRTFYTMLRVTDTSSTADDANKALDGYTCGVITSTKKSSATESSAYLQIYSSSISDSSDRGELATSDSDTIYTDTYYTLTFSAQGTNLTCTLTGDDLDTLTVEVSDDTYTDAGSVGFGGYKSDGKYISDFTVTSTAATAAPTVFPTTYVGESKYKFCEDALDEEDWEVFQGTLEFGASDAGVSCLAEMTNDTVSTWVYNTVQTDVKDVWTEITFSMGELWRDIYFVVRAYAISHATDPSTAFDGYWCGVKTETGSATATTTDVYLRLGVASSEGGRQGNLGDSDEVTMDVNTFYTVTFVAEGDYLTCTMTSSDDDFTTISVSATDTTYSDGGSIGFGGYKAKDKYFRSFAVYDLSDDDFEEKKRELLQRV